jgi:CRP-like cAMP-binding protein
MKKFEMATSSITYDKWQRALENPKQEERLVEMFNKLKIFKESSKEFVASVCRKLVAVEFKAGETIMEEDDAGDWMCFMLEGKADVTVQQPGTELKVKVSELRPGKYIGELALLGISLKRNATIIAQSNCIMLVFTKDALQQSLDEFPAEAPKWSHVLNTESNMTWQDLCSIKFFSNLHHGLVEMIHKHLRLKIFFNGEKLTRQGEYGREMYVILQGRVGVWINRNFIVAIKAPATIGELAFLGNDRRAATVVCDSMCLTLMVHADLFNAILEQFPEESKKFDHKAIQKIVGSNPPQWRKEVQEYEATWGKLLRPQQGKPQETPVPVNVGKVRTFVPGQELGKIELGTKDPITGNPRRASV